MSASLSNRQIARAAGVVLLGFLASGVFGLVRTAIINATFGATAATDAFNVAQRLPELIFVLVAGGALASAFIPIFARALQEDAVQAWRLASATLTLSCLMAAALSLLVIALAPVLIGLLIPGRSAEEQQLTIDLTRIMMLTPAIFSVSGLLMGILQTHQNFLLPSLAISMNNIGIIIGALLFAYWIPPQPGSLAQVGGANIYGLAWGAVLSAGLHLAVQVPGLRRMNFGGGALRPLADWRVPGVMDVLRLMGPRVLGLGVAQLNFLVNAYFASTMIAGSQTALTNAWTLMFTALGIVAQSVGSALFPTLSALAATDDMPGYKDRLATALRSVLFLALPATVGLILLGQPLIALVFERGLWTAESTAGTAWALAYFAVGIAGHAGLEVLSRAFYALSDTRTPVLVGVVSLLVNIGLSAVFIQWIGTPGSLARGPFAGLALANSVTTLLEAGVLWWLLRRRIGAIQDARVMDGVLRTLLAAGVMGGVLLLWLSVTDGRMAAPWVGLGGVALGGLVFLGVSYALKLDEVRAVTGLVLRRLKR
jgi:putative peptidoglycan lipid II flippase